MKITLHEEFFTEIEGILDNETVGALVRLIAVADEEMHVVDVVADAINDDSAEADESCSLLETLRENGFIRGTKTGWSLRALFEKGLVS